MAMTLAAVALLSGPAGAARAEPAPARAAAGWSVHGGTLTWTAGRRVPMGDAAVEFWAGDRLLGRAHALPDGRSFRLIAPAARDLEVRSGGRRIDQAPPAARRATPAIPALAAPAAVDPGRPGPYRTVRGEYALPGVRLPGLGEPVEMRAVVVAPIGAPQSRPLALFLHGRHFTCFDGPDAERTTGDWPCPAGSQPVPSHRGYLRAQQLLASQGYVTVSIAADGINGQDSDLDDAGTQARSSLVRLHLARWSWWAGAGRAGAPAIVRAAPRADLSRVLLIGHSRGGEGVSRAALDSRNPPPAATDAPVGPVRWTIRGIVMIGPTVFGQDPEPNVPSVTVLPGCDGDVADLQGQQYVDGTRGVSAGRALHSALYVIGANHNYFNAEWTPGQAAAPAEDDFSTPGDPLCSTGAPHRLTPAQQQTAGATYIAAAARLFVAGDDRVRPLLDGTGVRAPSADPVRVLSQAIGAARTPVIVPGPALRVAGARLCAEVSTDESTACLPGSDGYYGGSPHFVSFGSIAPEPGRFAVGLDGTAPAVLRPPRPAAVTGFHDLELRLIVPPNSGANRFAVAVTDGAGHRAALGEVSLTGLPGTGRTAAYWGRPARVALPRRLRSIASVELTRRGGTGPAWLLDAWGRNPGTPAPDPACLPRIDVGRLTAVEGDSGARTYEVPVGVRGRGSGSVRLFRTDPATSKTVSWLTEIRPGLHLIKVPVVVTGDTRYGGDRSYSVSAKAVRNVVVGDYEGGVRVTENDPVTARRAVAEPGGRRARGQQVRPVRALAVQGSAATRGHRARPRAVDRPGDPARARRPARPSPAVVRA
jgi:hypothetical protein